MLHWDWLPVNLETMALVPGEVACQNQQLSEQEHVQLLKGRKKKQIDEWLKLSVVILLCVCVCVLYSQCHSCYGVHRGTADSCTGQCEHLAACHQDTPACRCSTDTRTLPSSCWCQTVHPGWLWSGHTSVTIYYLQSCFKISVLHINLLLLPNSEHQSHLMECASGSLWEAEDI